MDRRVKDVLERPYTFIAKADHDVGGWVIVYPDLPGVMTQADTYNEIGEMAEDALRAWVENQIEADRPIPEPRDFAIPEWDWRTVEPELVSTKTAAQDLGVTPRRVLALAKSRGLGRRYGRSVMFTPSEVEAMQHRRAGRPSAADNQLPRTGR